ncbi:unnamed protein product [Periconia digitata]|uniref:Uncharacterized protein n=1 Tax=Periconia digitata TaxID=1303443 RepID=A0A9W4UTR0_9PLEO|nr:unnamed protein product [Periconia digitata]
MPSSTNDIQQWASTKFPAAFSALPPPKDLKFKAYDRNNFISGQENENISALVLIGKRRGKDTYACCRKKKVRVTAILVVQESEKLIQKNDLDSIDLASPFKLAIADKKSNSESRKPLYALIFYYLVAGGHLSSNHFRPNFEEDFGEACALISQKHQIKVKVEEHEGYTLDVLPAPSTDADSDMHGRPSKRAKTQHDSYNTDMEVAALQSMVQITRQISAELSKLKDEVKQLSSEKKGLENRLKNIEKENAAVKIQYNQAANDKHVWTRKAKDAEGKLAAMQRRCDHASLHSKSCEKRAEKAEKALKQANGTVSTLQGRIKTIREGAEALKRL